MKNKCCDGNQCNSNCKRPCCPNENNSCQSERTCCHDQRDANQMDSNGCGPYGSCQSSSPIWLVGDQRIVGPTGPWLPQDENGNNATCDSVLTNVELSGISVVTNGVVTEVVNEGVIPFNEQRNRCGTSILFDSVNHAITIQQSGNYFVSWGVNVDGLTGVGIFLELALSQFYETTTPINYLASSNIIQGPIVGSTIITTVGIPTVLILKNTSGYGIDLAQVRVQAWMNVISLNGVFQSTCSSWNL